MAHGFQTNLSFTFVIIYCSWTDGASKSASSCRLNWNNPSRVSLTRCNKPYSSEATQCIRLASEASSVAPCSLSNDCQAQ